MVENPENVNTPHEETNHRSGKEPMGSKISTNPQSRRTTCSRRAQPESGHSARTTRSRRTRSNVGPSMRTTRLRRTQRGNGQNHGTRDEELNHGGAQSVGEVAYEMENRRLRRRLGKAHRNAELERDAASTRAAQGTNAQNQPEPGRSPARNHQRSYQTHRARNRTNPDGGNTTNRSWDERTELEEASVTSRRSRIHSRSTRRGESTQRTNDRESMGTSKSVSHLKTKSMSRTRSVSKTRSVSNYSQPDLQEHLNQKKPELHQQLGPKLEDPIQLRINKLEDKFKRYQVGELGKLSGYDSDEELEPCHPNIMNTHFPLGFKNPHVSSYGRTLIRSRI
ncbi:uncharacterized protein LOC133034168 [Cannabis sativa]|uniref:uncharacterized protein LOC133034168 n=1 Tax=Cannabis sativa TaxID=3483 RepID=UPI0029CA5449|nr:uncharacterized protein LOC133034168 [Cannabis sativa]